MRVFKVFDCDYGSQKVSTNFKEILDTFLEWTKEDRVIVLYVGEVNNLDEADDAPMSAILAIASEGKIYSKELQYSVFDLLGVATFRCRCGLDIYYQGEDFAKCLDIMVEALDCDCLAMFLEVNIDGEWIPVLDGEYDFIVPTDYGKVFRKDLEMLGATWEIWDLD